MATTKKSEKAANGSVFASSLKKFGKHVDALAGKNSPDAVYLKTVGLIRTKVLKSGKVYIVTHYTNGKPSRENRVPSNEFEKNYRWFI
ncbi:hypothetical protein IDJ77_11165 [Mucilaginibacter sp. ZT4R22]|uniref:Uncharacterized protein n=1 Tax=Mucilaginibacter pankratovii TaxID=2772110 RepID=A0ABR7WQD0_9SPHI|nr:hypothetical protein [Mucilaginibacter pankratovii]MBD1364368.1 hypothetical protein [Mucilaginibacter pankratovii]